MAYITTIIKTGKKCVTGCKSFEGGEIKHHKDCPYYKNSMSELLDKLQIYEKVKEITFGAGSAQEKMEEIKKILNKKIND